MELSAAALHRKQALDHAAKAGSIAETCLRYNLSRSQFYFWRKRYLRDGLPGLEARPPISRSHRSRLSQGVRHQILLLSEHHPKWGCREISRKLAHMGMQASHEAIRHILRSSGMGSVFLRSARLEQAWRSRSSALTPDQISAIEEINPAFVDRVFHAKRPGDVLRIDTIALGACLGFERLFVHLAVDVHSQFAEGIWCPEKHGDIATVLLSKVIGQFSQRGYALPRLVVTSAASQFLGTRAGSLASVLQDLGIRHQVATGRQLGSCKAVGDALRRDFGAMASQDNICTSLSDHGSLEAWFEVWNNLSRPHWPIFGQSPAQVLR